MADIYTPKDEAELSGMIISARQNSLPLEICGYRSKRQAGRPLSPKAVVSCSNISGITLYEPNELVLSARAGTPLAEIEQTLAKKNQQLAFEPADLGRVLGRQTQGSSIGAVVAMNISGARRIQQGAARDHVLGIRAVNGTGEVIRSGGRVMKNVTGVDLVRGLCGSWGTLAVLTEVTLKVLPKPRESRTLLFHGLADEGAIGMMCAALATPYEVSGTLHLHAPMVARLEDKDLAPANSALTALRLEGTANSLLPRTEKLRQELAPFGDSYELPHERSVRFWDSIRAMSHLVADPNRPLWRIAAAPSQAAQIVGALSSVLQVSAAYDWSGGLIWLELPPASDASSSELRRMLAEFQADAMLMRAPRAIRANVEVFQPLPLPKMKIVQGLKHAFDPGGILNPGRMYAGV
jgi:glycolate oxidase FAD binding subunit